MPKNTDKSTDKTPKAPTTPPTTQKSQAMLQEATTPTTPNPGSSSSSLDPKAALEEAIKKKREIERNLMDIEKQIYNFEGSYLEDTAIYGNVVKGWERYLTLKTATAADLCKLKKFKDSDRLFSHSSVTYQYAINGEGYKDHLKELLLQGPGAVSKSSLPSAGVAVSGKKRWNQDIQDKEEDVVITSVTPVKTKRKRNSLSTVPSVKKNK